jgi:cysteine-rich repeat protein
MNRFARLTCLGTSFGLTLLLSACPADEVPADDEAGTEDTTGDGDTTTDTGTTTADTGETTADTTDTGGSCGNGELDSGEACDDGNTEDGDGCSATCQVTACGLVWSVSSQIDSATNGGFDTVVGDGGDVFTAGLKIEADNDAWVARYNQDGLVWESTFDSGNGNEAALAITLGPGGDVYVAGWMEADGDAIWFARLAADTGAVVWEQMIDGMFMEGDDRATGIAPAEDGDSLVVSGRTRVADGDDDVWVSKIASSDGAEIWASTWSGTGDGMFSTDRSGAVAVDDSGEVWVAAREHVDFETQEATVLHFGADGSFMDMIQPLADGGAHQHDPIDIAAAGGAIYFAAEKTDFPYRGWLYKLGTDGSEEWLKTEADWVTIGEDWAVRGIGLDQNGNLNVGGVFSNEEPGEGISWGEAWMARLDPAGEYLCRTSHMEDDGAVIPPSLGIDSAGAGASGATGMTGVLSAGQGSDQWLWVGYFSE